MHSFSHINHKFCLFKYVISRGKRRKNLFSWQFVGSSVCKITEQALRSHQHISCARVSPGRTFCTSLTLSPHTVKPNPSWSFCTTTHLWTRPGPGRGGQKDVKGICGILNDISDGKILKSILKQKHKAAREVAITRTLSTDVDRWLSLLGGRGFALRVPDGQTAEPGFEI